MIFNNDYDKSLWLMIYGDIINRDKISLVINNISFELLYNIQELIRQYNIDNISNSINYERDNIKYIISINNFELSIKMIREIDGLFEEIELFILPYDDEYINQMKLNSTFSLGGFVCRNYFGDIKCGSTLDEYEIVKNVFGKYIKLYIDNRVKFINRQRINVKKIPDSFDIMDIRSDKGIKRLIREMK